MAGRIRAHDWSATPLGPSEAWPLPLRTAVEMMLASPILATLAVGPERVFVYNDEAARHYGDRHPGVLGRPLAQAFAHEFADVAPFYDRTFDGESLHVPGQRLDPSRRGTAEVFDAYLTPVRGVGGDVIAAYMAGFAVGERLRAEAKLRASEERQVFLLKLSDALRPIADPIAIQRIATRMLGEHLQATRVFYVVVGDDGDTAEILDDYTDGAPSRVGRYSLGAFSSAALGEWRAGRTVSTSDVDDDPRYSSTEREAYASVSTRAGFGVPLIKEGRLVALLGVNQAAPRRWSDHDIDLTNEVAERTWTAVERAHVEAALRESEERYRAVFESIDEGVVTFDVIFDADGKAIDALYLEHNAVLSRMTGLTTDIVGRRMREVLPNLEPVWFETFGRVIGTGEPSRFEYMVHDLEDQWFDVFAARVGGEGSHRIVLVYNNITERKRAEVALRQGEERQAFLLKLSDALRAEDGVDAVAGRATRMVADRLALDRFYLASIDGDLVVVTHEDRREGLPPILGAYRGSDFPAAFRAIFGRTIAYDDIETDPGLSDLDRRSLAGLGAGSLAAVAVRRGGERMIWAAGAISAAPRRWTAADLALLEDATERIWAAIERARAEAALQESEERFAQFAASSSDALWIRDAATLAMEYASPAIEAIYGVPPDALLGDPKRWAAIIVPEDRAAALEHLEQARGGEPVAHEFRIQRPSDGSFRWIRNTDFPLQVNGHVQRIGGIAHDATDEKLAAEHQAVLLAELQHRVRNIMALVRSITARTGERAASVQEYTALMLGRLQAFARVQALLTRAANASVGIASIVHDEVSVQAQHEAQYRLEGPDVDLSPKAAEVLTLAVHEFATNAVKYGALSAPNGRVTVSWSTFEGRGGTWLAFDWAEAGAPERLQPAAKGPTRRGFGSELIEGRVPYELKGRGSIVIEPGGVRARLEFPLQGGASILETGAPQRATVFGGALDMAGEVNLDGHRILVVEDDYYLATDAARALQGAGAEVLGPCGSEEDARAELVERRPDAVILDINLGSGPSFRLAEHLKDSGIPFVFATGYDQEVIPAEFEGVARLEKPFQLRQVVDAAARLVGRAS